MHFKAINLAGGKRAIIPSLVKLLNCEMEGKKEFLYFVWPLDGAKPDEPCTLQDALDGKGIGPAFGYLTDYSDLYKLGRHDAPMLRARFNEATVDYLDMTERLVKTLSPMLDEGVEWGYAWCICDVSGNEVPVGTSPVAVVNKKVAWDD